MIHIQTKRCIGGGRNRWIAWHESASGLITAAFGFTEEGARRGVLRALDARDAALVARR